MIVTHPPARAIGPTPSRVLDARHERADTQIGPMISYSLSGRVLRIVTSGETSNSVRAGAFEKIEHDPDIPDGVLFLIDVRTAAQTAGSLVARDRAYMVAALMGAKKSRWCALVLPPPFSLDATLFQMFALDHGVYVRLFTDDVAAEQWLAVHADDPIAPPEL